MLGVMLDCLYLSVVQVTERFVVAENGLYIIAMK